MLGGNEQNFALNKRPSDVYNTFHFIENNFVDKP